MVGARAEYSLVVSAKRDNPVMVRGGHCGTWDARKRDQPDRSYVCIRTPTHLIPTWNHVEKIAMTMPYRRILQ